LGETQEALLDPVRRPSSCQSVANAVAIVGVVVVVVCRVQSPAPPNKKYKIKGR
jgi:hypothetical protein